MDIYDNIKNLTDENENLKRESNICKAILKY